MLVHIFIRCSLCIDLRRRLWYQAGLSTMLGDSNRWRGSVNLPVAHLEHLFDMFSKNLKSIFFGGKQKIFLGTFIGSSLLRLFRTPPIFLSRAELSTWGARVKLGFNPVLDDYIGSYGIVWIVYVTIRIMGSTTRPISTHCLVLDKVQDYDPDYLGPLWIHQHSKYTLHSKPSEINTVTLNLCSSFHKCTQI